MTDSNPANLQWIPTVKPLAIIAAALDATPPVRPDHVAHVVIDALCSELNAIGRTELVHYAGACHRDDVAWHVVLAWWADRTASESVLKSRALQATGWGDITPEDVRAANKGML